MKGCDLLEQQSRPMLYRKPLFTCCVIFCFAPLVSCPGHAYSRLHYTRSSERWTVAPLSLNATPNPEGRSHLTTSVNCVREGGFGDAPTNQRDSRPRLATWSRSSWM